MSNPTITRDEGRGVIGLSRCPKLTPGCVGVCDIFSKSSVSIIKEELSKKILEYMKSYRMPLLIQINKLWNNYPVISLGENHTETHLNAQFMANIVKFYGRSNDVVAVEGSRDDQDSVDDYLQDHGELGFEKPRSKEFKDLIQACKERQCKFVFMGEGRGNDELFFDDLKEYAGDLKKHRLLLLTGRGHGLWRHSGSTPKFLSMVADKVGYKKVTTVFLQSRDKDPGGILYFEIVPHDDNRQISGTQLRLAIHNLGSVLIPTNRANSPFNCVKFAYYKEYVSKTVDFIALI
ncbi:hypothetical protein MNBD_GAMMA09-1823 [hydrothermal vent metagenome]|uniref:Haem-binding uptake Tiki superfamily ChaN domain-containing protein n=1 Tax=hydrothermal vent metagenome TaxID=652676 RepID=A0A3B0XH20_9ZZZZ